MTDDELVSNLSEKSDIEVARFINLGLLMNKGISEQNAGFDTVVSLNDAGLAFITRVVAALRGPRAP